MNSIEAMPVGCKITVKLDIIDKFVEVNVTDTGLGIPEEIRDQLFQPFFSTKSSNLGLSFCKLIIESNRGSIDIYSVERGHHCTCHAATVALRWCYYPKTSRYF